MDGFLKLDVPSSKATLYDEFDKQLVCTMVENVENVTSLEGGKKPKPNLNVDRKQKSRSIFTTPLVNGEKNVLPAKECLSPSKQAIKEFMKRAMIKYASPNIIKETTKPSTSMNAKEEKVELEKKGGAKRKMQPTCEELRATLREVMIEEIGNFITTSYIVDKLSLKLDVDLTHRVDEVKDGMLKIVHPESGSYY